jgi:hypothetical protein
MQGTEGLNRSSNTVYSFVVRITSVYDSSLVFAKRGKSVNILFGIRLQKILIESLAVVAAVGVSMYLGLV